MADTNTNLHTGDAFTPVNISNHGSLNFNQKFATLHFTRPFRFNVTQGQTNQQAMALNPDTSANPQSYTIWLMWGIMTSGTDTNENNL